MNKPSEITEQAYLVGGPDITSSMDCCVYLINGGSELALIDAGAGPSAPRLVSNIADLGFEPREVGKIILTHCHIDHVGGTNDLRRELGAQVLAHELTAKILEPGDSPMTAADLYGLELSPINVDIMLSGKDNIDVGVLTLHSLHTPGHTPDSITLYLDEGEKRLLFGQDIHGPLSPEFGSDITAWQHSMETLLALEADILCEGHFGIYDSAEAVKEYIEGYIDYYTGRR